MEIASTGGLEALVLVNVILGVFCLGCVLVVLGAVWLDVRERRAWRAMVPDGWPPPGEEAEDLDRSSPPTRGRALPVSPRKKGSAPNSLTGGAVS